MMAEQVTEGPFNADAMDVCDACEGVGKVDWSFHPNDPEPFEKTCVHCDGTGYIVRAADECDLDYIRDCGDPFK